MKRISGMLASVMLFWACSTQRSTPSGATTNATSAPTPPTTSASNRPENVGSVERPPQAAEVIAKYAEPLPPEVSVTFSTRNGDLGFTQGNDWYSLETIGTSVTKVVKTVEGYRLDYECSFCCVERNPRHLLVPRSAVAARLQNNAAYRRYRKGDFLAAAKGFAAAVRADGTLAKARRNLASALARGGQADEAVAVLLDENATLSLSHYLTVVQDSDLAPLREHRWVVPSRAKQRGDVALQLEAGSPLYFDLARSAERGLLAQIVIHRSWGSSAFNADLELFSMANGKRVLRHRFLSMRDTNPDDAEQGAVLPESRKAVSQQFAALTTFLQDLGFRTIPSDDRINGTPRGRSTGQAYTLGALGVDVTTDPDYLRTFRSGKLLERYKSPTGLGNLESAVYLPHERLLVVSTHLDEPEGCNVERDIANGMVVPLDLNKTLQPSQLPTPHR